MRTLSFSQILKRLQLVREIAEAETEYAAGGCEPRTVDELMQEILS